MYLLIKKDRIMEKVIRPKQPKLYDIFKLIVEQQKNNAINSGDSFLTCNASTTTKLPNTFWSNDFNRLDQNAKNALLEKIESEISIFLEKSKKEYIVWFSNPKTKSKFKPNELEGLNKLVTEYLRSKINIKLFTTIETPNVIAWINGGKLYDINYALPLNHDGKDFIRNIYETTKHELGHLIDNFLSQNGVKTYITTIVTNTQALYDANYAINDRDQYARLNVLRGSIDADPMDNSKTLLKKFLYGVKSGNITSERYSFSPSKLEINTKKNDNEQTKSMLMYLNNTIKIDGKRSMNTEQLFATFATKYGKDIYVNFNLLSSLNQTSVSIGSSQNVNNLAENVTDETGYYYLKLSVKQNLGPTTSTTPGATTSPTPGATTSTTPGATTSPTTSTTTSPTTSTTPGATTSPTTSTTPGATTSTTTGPTPGVPGVAKRYPTIEKPYKPTNGDPWEYAYDGKNLYVRNPKSSNKEVFNLKDPNFLTKHPNNKLKTKEQVANAIASIKNAYGSQLGLM
jgi:hypothetical protein